MKIEDRIAKNKSLSLLEQLDLKESFVSSGQDTRDRHIDVSNFKFNSTGDFHGLENILHFMAYYEGSTKQEVTSKSWWRSLSFPTADPDPPTEEISRIVVKNPRYFYYFNSDKRRKIELDVRVEKSNTVKFFDKANGDLIIEAEDAAIIDDRVYYASAARREIGESISELIEYESFIPQLGLYNLRFKEIVQIDVRS